METERISKGNLNEKPDIIESINRERDMLETVESMMDFRDDTEFIENVRESSDKTNDKEEMKETNESKVFRKVSEERNSKSWNIKDINESVFFMIFFAFLYRNYCVRPKLD